MSDLQRILPDVEFKLSGFCTRILTVWRTGSLLKLGFWQPSPCASARLGKHPSQGLINCLFEHPGSKINHGLLRINHGLIWGVATCCIGPLGFPGRVLRWEYMKPPDLTCLPNQAPSMGFEPRQLSVPRPRGIIH